MSAALDSESTESIDTPQADKALAFLGEASRKWVDRQVEKNRLREAQARARSRSRSRSPSSRSASSSRSSSPSRVPWEEPLDELFLASQEEGFAFTPEEQGRFRDHVKAQCQAKVQLPAALKAQRDLINLRTKQLADHSDSDDE